MKWLEILEFLQSLLVSCQLEALSFLLFNSTEENVKREGKLDRKVVVFCFQVSCFKAVFLVFCRECFSRIAMKMFLI